MCIYCSFIFTLSSFPALTASPHISSSAAVVLFKQQNCEKNLRSIIHIPVNKSTIPLQKHIIHATRL